MAVASSGGPGKRVITVGSRAPGEANEGPIGSIPCWPAVQIALMIRLWLSAPHQLRFPLQTLRSDATAARVACLPVGSVDVGTVKEAGQGVGLSREVLDEVGAG